MAAAGSGNGEVAEPEIIGVFYYLDSATSQLKDLERQTSISKTKLRAGGFRGAKAIGLVNGTRSSFRLKDNQPTEFIVRLGRGADPAKIQLYRWEVNLKKNRREVTLASAGVAGISAKSGPGPLLVNVAEYGEHSYKITPAEPLGPGEYVLGESDSNEAFCFGID